MGENACRNKAFFSTSTKFNPYFGWYKITPAKVGLNLVKVLENALFVHAFGYMVELTVTGWCIIAT